MAPVSPITNGYTNSRVVIAVCLCSWCAGNVLCVEKLMSTELTIVLYLGLAVMALALAYHIGYIAGRQSSTSIISLLESTVQELRNAKIYIPKGSSVRTVLNEYGELKDEN